MTTTLRIASAFDVPFLTEAIIAAETSGNSDEPTTYEKMLGLSRSECVSVIRALLESDSKGNQFARDSFFVLEQDGTPAATCVAWVEGSDGSSSGFLVASALSRVLGVKRFAAAGKRIRALSKVAPERSRGSLQLETFFVAPPFRGQALTARLISAVREHFVSAHVEFSGMQISLLNTNNRALRAYENAGFRIVREQQSADPLFNEITNATGFIQVHAD